MYVCKQQYTCDICVTSSGKMYKVPVIAHDSNDDMHMLSSLTKESADILKQTAKPSSSFDDDPSPVWVSWLMCRDEWVSEQFLNGTSAQLGYTVPFKLDVVKKI